MDAALVQTPGIAPGTMIRSFLDTHLQETIDQALQTVPEGHKGAVVAYADTEGAKLAVMARLGPAWSVVGTLNYG